MIASLALVLVCQAPVPAPEGAPAEPAAPATTPASVSPEAAAAAPESPSALDDFFSEGHVGHYLKHYGADYVAVAAAGTLFATGVFSAVEPLPALIGPRIDLKEPDLDVLDDSRLSTQIGMPLVHEQIPDRWLAVGIAGVMLTHAGVDLAVSQDLHRTHNLVLGSAEAVLGAMALTEALKLTVGRLRPDFRERYLRAACGESIERPSDLDCSGVPDDGYVPSREDVLDGMKSFPSGHTSTSVAALSFLTLSIGSTYLWGGDMPWWTQPLAGIAIGALSGGALYVAGTRLTDNRHHLEDILAGAGIGLASGSGAFLLHFEPNGRARRRGISVTPVPLDGGAGVAVSGPL